jgi:hypothetical protein
MNIKSKIVAAFILTAAAAIAPLSATPAQAADPYIWICNASTSDDNITAWHLDLSYRVTINQGDCKSVNDRSGNARVDVDPAGGENDIDSYRIYTDCYPFNCSNIVGPCHDGENGSSNPDSSGVRTSHYVTSKYSGCL